MNARTLGILFAASFACAAASRVGEIGGVVSDGKGTPVAGAAVTLRLLPISKFGKVPNYRVNATTGKDGSYVVRNLPPGPYEICVALAGSNLLDPCTWSKEPPGGLVGAGEKRKVNVPMATGRQVTIRIDDNAKGEMELLENKGQGSPHIGLFVRAERVRTVTPSLVKRDATGRDYSVLVPLTHDVQVSIVSHGFLFARAEAPDKPVHTLTYSIPAQSGLTAAAAAPIHAKVIGLALKK